MPADSIRTFSADYQGEDCRSKCLNNAGEFSQSVASARSFLMLLGVVFALAGIYIAWAFDRLVGMGVLVVGAFLLILPFTAVRSDE